MVIGLRPNIFQWLEYFGTKFGRVTVAVNPAYTSQDCSNCGATVKKSLSTLTHVCECGCELDRDPSGSQSLMGETTAVAPLGGTPRPHCLPKTALSHHNAAINILNSALGTTGHVGTWINDPNALPRFAHHAKRYAHAARTQTGDSTSTGVGAILSSASWVYERRIPATKVAGIVKKSRLNLNGFF